MSKNEESYVQVGVGDDINEFPVTGAYVRKYESGRVVLVVNRKDTEPYELDVSEPLQINITVVI